MVGGGGGGGGGGGHGGGGCGGSGGGHGGGVSHGGGGVLVAPLIGYSSRSNRGGGSSMADESTPLLDKSYQKFRTRMEYFLIAGYMLVVAMLMMLSRWPDLHVSLVIVITFSYTTAMALLLVRHYNNKTESEDQLELIAAPNCAPQSTLVLMLVVSGIMLISLVLTVSIFPIKSDDLGQFMFLSVVCAMMGFGFVHQSTRNNNEC